MQAIAALAPRLQKDFDKKIFTLPLACDKHIANIVPFGKEASERKNTNDFSIRLMSTL
jgi:hypothetical protein